MTSLWCWFTVNGRQGCVTADYRLDMKNIWKDEMYQLAPLFKPKHFRFLKGFSCHTNSFYAEVNLDASTSECALKKVLCTGWVDLTVYLYFELPNVKGSCTTSAEHKIFRTLLFLTVQWKSTGSKTKYFIVWTKKRWTIPLRASLQCEDWWEECHKNSSEEFISQREGDTIVMRKPELCITCIVKWAVEKWHYYWEFHQRANTRKREGFMRWCGLDDC